MNEQYLPTLALLVNLLLGPLVEFDAIESDNKVRKVSREVQLNILIDSFGDLGPDIVDDEPFESHKAVLLKIVALRVGVAVPPEHIEKHLEEDKQHEEEEGDH